MFYSKETITWWCKHIHWQHHFLSSHLTHSLTLNITSANERFMAVSETCINRLINGLTRCRSIYSRLLRGQHGLCPIANNINQPPPIMEMFENWWGNMGDLMHHYLCKSALQLSQNPREVEERLWCVWSYQSYLCTWSEQLKEDLKSKARSSDKNYTKSNKSICI